MTESEQPLELEKMSVGIEPLDHILFGGLNRNHVYLVDGLPGTGKTTLAMQFLLAGARQGEKGVYIALSETTRELRLIAKSHGWSLEGILLYELSQVTDQLREESQHTVFHPSDVELGEATRPMLDMLDRERPTRVVFDSLSEMRLLAGEPLRYRRQILLLKQHFTQQNCTVLFLDDHVESGGDLQIQSIVHGVIRLERLAMNYGAERRRLSIVKMRGSTFRGGFHDFRIETGGLHVYPRLVAAEHQAEYEAGAVSSGIQELDVLLGGGLDRGMAVLFLGPAGVGKSALATQFASAAANRGEKSLIILFDETRKRLLARSDSLHLDVRKHVEDGAIQIRQVDPAEMTPGEMAELACTAVERDGVRHVHIDSLNGYLNAMPEERFLLLQLHELLTYLAQQGAVAYLIGAQHGVIGERLAGTVDVSYLADVVILLRYFETSGEIRRAISILKKRSGGHEETIREFKIRSDGFHFGPPLREFQGVLTGTPVYRGEEEQLMKASDGKRGNRA